jgi:hypothetical protein
MVLLTNIHRIDEGVLRRSLFEHTGGSYPEVRKYNVSVRNISCSSQL